MHFLPKSKSNSTYSSTVQVELFMYFSLYPSGQLYFEPELHNYSIPLLGKNVHPVTVTMFSDQMSLGAQAYCHKSRANILGLNHKQLPLC